MHPIQWCINQVGEQLALTLSALEAALEQGIENSPDMQPIEYLPTPDTGVYFGDRQSLRSVYRSSIVLKA